MPRSKIKITRLNPNTDNVIEAINKISVQRRSIRKGAEEFYVIIYLIAVDRIQNIYQR